MDLQDKGTTMNFSHRIVFFMLFSLVMALCAKDTFAAEAAALTNATEVVEVKAQTSSEIEKNVKKRYTLEEAIAATPTGVGKGEIDVSAAPGFLDIPGAPQINLVLAFVWAVWVGWIFSTVGAFGGIMSGVGHISIFGLGGYASAFPKGSPMNTMITDSIRLSNQWLVGFSALITSIKSFLVGRIVLPLGIALGIGSLAGSILIPRLTQGKVSFSGYQGFFGLFVLGLGLYLLYQTTSFAQAKQKKIAVIAKAFEEARKVSGESGEKPQLGVEVTSISFSRVFFKFCGVDFSFSTFIPVLGGFIIASAASFLGVGGGFLLVPFLTSIAQLPMYLAAGTSAFAVLIGMVASISTFMVGGVPIFWKLVAIELGGVAVGSWIGPMTARFIPDKWLKRLFVLIALIVGLDFTLKGFWGIRLL